MEVKTAISLLEMNKSGFYIILTDGNLPNHMDPFQLLQNFLQRNDGMNFPVIKILSNGFVRCDYHPLASTVVMPVLELVGKHFCMGLNKSDEVQQQKEEEHHDEDIKILKRKKGDEHDQGKVSWREEHEDTSVKSVNEINLHGNEVQQQREEEHYDEGIKTLKRKKGDEHDHQGKISWRGELQEAFLKSVNEISLHGKATGKQVQESLRGKGFSNVSLKQVNSHLQKHRNKLKECKGHVGGISSEQVSSSGRQENLYKSDAPFFSTVDGDLSTTHPKHHLHVDNIQSIIEGSTLGGYQSSSLMTNGGQSSDLFVNDIQGEALDEDVTVMVGDGSACHPSSDYYRMDTPTDTLHGDFSFYITSEDIAQQQYPYYSNGR